MENKSWKNTDELHGLLDRMGVTSKQEHRPYVCLDTNVIVSLATLFFEHEEGFVLNRDPKTLDAIKKLQQCIEKGEIKPIVTQYVLQELYVGSQMHGNDCFRYMKDNNIYVLNIPKSSNIDVHYFEDVENTALRYCGRCKSPYASHPKEGKKEENKIFSLWYAFKLKRPDIRALIMAEASLLGVPLLTFNVKHFIADEKDENIKRINGELKLGEGVMPYTPKVFLTFYELKHKFPEPKGQYKQYLTPANKIPEIVSKISLVEDKEV